MVHDLAVLDKPCLYLNYNPVKNPKIKDVYNFQHFKNMGNLDAVGWINSKEEILFKVKETLCEPKTTVKDRKKWLDRIVKYKNTSAIEFMNKLIN